MAWDKKGGFIGRDALLRQRDAGVSRRLVHVALADSSRLLYHNEPIWRDGALVGHITSGMFGHSLGKSLGLGYVANRNGPADAAFVDGGRYEVEIAGDRVAAEVSRRPFYDPTSLRVKDRGGQVQGSDNPFKNHSLWCPGKDSRTFTIFRPLVPETSASTNSATWAGTGAFRGP